MFRRNRQRLNRALGVYSLSISVTNLISPDPYTNLEKCACDPDLSHRADLRQASLDLLPRCYKPPCVDLLPSFYSNRTRHRRHVCDSFLGSESLIANPDASGGLIWNLWQH